MVTADLSTYHDPGQLHIDTDLMAVDHAHHHKDLLPFNAIMRFLVSPKVFARDFPPFAGEIYLSKFTYLSQFPPRAPPA